MNLPLPEVPEGATVAQLNITKEQDFYPSEYSMSTSKGVQCII